MADLTFEEVAVLAKAVGLNLLGDDLVEVTHRLNVALSEIESISNADINAVPTTLLPAEDAGWTMNSLPN